MEKCQNKPKFHFQSQKDKRAFKANIDGGYLELHGFNTSHNDKMILAFSFEGKHIPKGEHLLCSLNVQYENESKEAKISNMVLAGQGGSALDFGFFDFSKNQTTLRSTY